MEAPQSVNEIPVKKSKIPLIVVAVAGFYGLFAIRSVETQVVPQVPQEDFATSAPATDLPFDTPDPGAEAGEPPTGGLGNDILRQDTWQYVAAAAAGQGCDQPVGADSTIEVLQEPNAG